MLNDHSRFAERERAYEACSLRLRVVSHFARIGPHKSQDSGGGGAGRLRLGGDDKRFSLGSSKK